MDESRLREIRAWLASPDYVRWGTYDVADAMLVALLAEFDRLTADLAAATAREALLVAALGSLGNPRPSPDAAPCWCRLGEPHTGLGHGRACTQIGAVIRAAAQPAEEDQTP